jgi:CheY-like chemotaxis protein
VARALRTVLQPEDPLGVFVSQIRRQSTTALYYRTIAVVNPSCQAVEPGRRFFFRLLHPQRNLAASPSTPSNSARAGYGLPLARVSGALAMSPGSAKSPTPDEISRRILVIDDHADASETMALLLRAVGHQVLVAADGVSALTQAPSFRPDVILLDIGLPGMSGFEVAKRLRTVAETQSTVLVAISGYGTDQDRRRALAAGIDHYFTKPVGLETLRDFLATLPTRS